MPDQTVGRQGMAKDKHEYLSYVVFNVAMCPLLKRRFLRSAGKELPMAP
jgi:hypothetical protein